MYVVAYNRASCLIFEQWADQNYGSELAAAGYLFDVSPAQAAEIMSELGVGKIDAVKARGWSGAR